MDSTAGSPASGQALGEALALKVRKARENKRMSKPELARRTGLPLEFIDRLEKGQADMSQVRMLDLQALATALDVDYADLVERREPDGIVPPRGP
jgi:transcriptional regulator with XRE-family HTH domain